MAVYTIAVLLLAGLLLQARNTDACGEDIQFPNFTKNILSPGFPSLYKSSQSCGWKINASSPEHLVGVTYDARLASNDCQLGSLSFYDGPDDSSELLLQLCGIDVGGILSSGSTMYIQFKSSALSLGSRFSLTPKNTERCGGALTATSQVTNISLPGSPYTSYRNFKTCQWIVTPENEKDTVKIILGTSEYFRYFSPCKQNVIRVYNGNTTEDNQFLGETCSKQWSHFYSSTNSLLLVLITNGNETSMTLEMQYSSRPEGNCNTSLAVYNTPIYILSPGYPNSYGSDLTCSILLNTPPSLSNMKLDILTADMEGNYPQCPTDSVRVFEGEPRNYYPTGEFCGNSSISPIGPYYSNGLFMALVFKSNSATSGKVFRLRVSHTSRKVIPRQSANCGTRFRNATADPEIISTPGYPVLSSARHTCIWTLMAPSPEMMMRIVVIDSDVPGFLNYYTVTFYNGPSIFNDTIFSWRGDYKPTLQSTVSAMTVQFMSNTVFNLKGFRLKYFATNEPYRCGGTVTINSVENRTLTGPYQNSQDCHWTIHAPAGMNIQVKVLNLVPYNPPTTKYRTCNADYVEIYDGEFDSTRSTSTGKWCGQYSDGFISLGSSVTARFHSGIDNEYRGIQIVVKAGHFSASRMTSYTAGIIEKYVISPNYPFYYPSNVERTWKINAGDYYRVKISVTYSQLERSAGCQNDYVEAFDGSDSTASSLGRWCGDTKPDKTSSGSFMFLKFRSNSQVVERGFIIKYETEYSGISSASNPQTWTIVGSIMAGVVVVVVAGM